MMHLLADPEFWVLVAAVMGCDTKVTNPGPVQDEFLFKRLSQAVKNFGRGVALLGITAQIGRHSISRRRPGSPPSCGAASGGA